MSAFTFETTPRIISEDHGAEKLGALCAELGVKTALLVTDRGLIAAGVLEPALAGFKAAGVKAVLFSDVLADPPQTSVEEAIAFAKGEGIDGVIGFGGGSSMDTAKLVALLVGSGQALPEVYGINVAKGRRLPLIQVPTTAGTGSEVTPIAIVTKPDDEKAGIISSHLYPDIALLDATLTVGLPARVTAMTGIDAMVHAIESYTSKFKKNPISDALAVKALALLSANMRPAIADGKNLAARRAMLQGSMLAGMAFANAPVAAVHALAYPLGGFFHVPHGLSNALVLSPILAYNMPEAWRLYAELAPITAPDATFRDTAHAADHFVETMKALVADMPMEQRLTEVGVVRDDIDRLAEAAMKQQRLLVNNPRAVNLEDAVSLYLSAL